MKAIIPATIVAAFTLAAAPLAEARPHHHRGKHYPSHVYVSGYRSCGTPIYQERYVTGYKRCGTPVWGYRKIKHHPRHHYVPRPQYCPPRPVCPPPSYYHRGNRIVIQGSFGF